MASRLTLHEVFCTILNSRNVYFQPPESLKIEYPCIKYSVSGVDVKRANDHLYLTKMRYEVIYISKNPDSMLVEEILKRFPMSRFDRTYIADNLYHNVFTIYY